MATLEDILKTSNSYLDLEFSLPTGSELATRVDFANQAVRDACSAYSFPEFSEIYQVFATCATVSLPLNFRELEEIPVIETNGIWEEYPQINPKDRINKLSTDEYCYVLGSPNHYNLYINGLSSAATISIQYQRYPSGMATLTDVCELPDAEYVKLKLISYVLQSRSDERFPTLETETNNRLFNMMGRSAIQPSGGVRQIPNKQVYRIGK